MNTFKNKQKNKKFSCKVFNFEKWRFNTVKEISKYRIQFPRKLIFKWKKFLSYVFASKTINKKNISFGFTFPWNEMLDIGTLCIYNEGYRVSISPVLRWKRSTQIFRQCQGLNLPFSKQRSMAGAMFDRFHPNHDVNANRDVVMRQM